MVLVEVYGVGAEIGGGFYNTKDLCPMQYNEAICAPTAKFGQKQSKRSTSK